MLSEISRKLGETTTLKKVTERLSYNLKNFSNTERLFENYLHSVKSQNNKNTILIFDRSDITKNYTTKSEGIADVRDGSSGEYKLGYYTRSNDSYTRKENAYSYVYKNFFRKGKRIYQRNRRNPKNS